jgi:peptidylprolyl isomerase
MAQVQAGDTVRVHYTGMLEDGTLIGTSTDVGPLQFTLGQGNVIPGFERALIGMRPGTFKIEKVPCELAFGPYRENLTAEVDRQKLMADGITPYIGLELEVHHSSGMVPMLVTQIHDNRVRLDANHPLAGQDLIFEIELVEIVPMRGPASTSGRRLCRSADDRSGGMSHRT